MLDYSSLGRYAKLGQYVHLVLDKKKNYLFVLNALAILLHSSARLVVTVSLNGGNIFI